MLLLKKIIYGINEHVLKIAMLLIVLMMFVTVADVMGRMFFKPLPGTFELTRLALAVIVFTSLGYSQIHKVHIAINILVSRLPFKAQHYIEVLNTILSLATFSIVVWQMLKYAERLASVNQVTAVLRTPVHPWVIVSAVGVFFFCLALLWDLIVGISKLKGGDVDEYRSPWSA